MDPSEAEAAGAGVEAFARSELFERTFREGMELVEAAAAYLDGEGRRESKLLSRDAALAYAGESMRLTTRLMQVASWLLVQRAVRRGEMAPEDARQPRYRLDAPPPPPALDEAGREALPATIAELAERSERLFDRVRQLDRRLHEAEAAAGDAHPVLAAQARLRSAFGAT
jgi:regulator of CtrA degradation